MEIQISFKKMNLIMIVKHDMTYDKSKDLIKRTQSDKALNDKAFTIASDPKNDGYQRGLASMVYKFLIKSRKEVVLLMNQIINQQINFINQLLENFKKEKCIHILGPIFGVLIQLIRNY